ncbi:putative glycerol kinase 5 isoform X2 [Xenopus laevis]|uniref:Glycerol kinase 5 n=1 Tax=Xenopus laevis TaxID=8355 RepID=A0A8J1KLC8_XENLA|nr:putative glycerol kinase 5 isoform X2 [Xenopus laevis]
MSSPRNGYRDRLILAVDVGSSVLRCHLYNQSGEICGSAEDKLKVLYPQAGYVEIDPESLWEQFVRVVKEAVADAGIQMSQVAGLGISTQRGTFITWNKKTGETFHNFISWQDLRAADLVSSWNRSLLLKAVHGVCTALHFFTRRKRFLAASLINFTTQHVSLRLVWVLQNIPQVRQAAEKGNCCFGTIDTWLLHKLTKGTVFATDYSNASGTAVFDPYLMCWSSFLCSLLSIPLSIFPPVEDTSHSFGLADPTIFGAPVPILALVADQQAAMFGQCCFDVGSVKLTMGTGSFISINTGETLHTSIAGLYPLIGWKVGDEVVCLAEGNASDTGTAIKWAEELNLFTSVADTETMARSVPDCGGIYFVPSFSGLQAPINDPYACASFMGLKPSTSKSHLVRAILESVAYRNKQLYDTVLRETTIPITLIRADGGVSNNNFIMQMTADLLGQTIDKPKHTDMSSLGAAFLAGMAVGLWSTKDELKKLRTTQCEFEPQAKWKEYERSMGSWEVALQRCSNWYNTTASRKSLATWFQPIRVWNALGWVFWKKC